MPRIPIFKLGASSGGAQPPRLASYVPTLSLDGIQLGIDNVRHDVWLSPAFTKPLGAHIAKLIARFGNVESVISAEAVGSIGGPRNLFAKVTPTAAKNPDVKPLLLELHKSALNRAKAEGNVSIDLFARAAVIKFLRAELNAQ